MPRRYRMVPGDPRILPWRRLLFPLPYRRRRPVHHTRVNIIKGLGPVLQIAEGWSVELPKDVHDILNKRTNSTWPTTWFAPRLTGKGPFTDVYSVMANWGANHGVLTIGHVGADFITLASMLRIPVCMHNVEETKVYRPSAWPRTAWILKARITALARLRPVVQALIHYSLM